MISLQIYNVCFNSHIVQWVVLRVNIKVQACLLAQVVVLEHTVLLPELLPVHRVVLEENLIPLGRAVVSCHHIWNFCDNLFPNSLVKDIKLYLFSVLLTAIMTPRAARAVDPSAFNYKQVAMKMIGWAEIWVLALSLGYPFFATLRNLTLHI